jgi:hypothetical protein
MQDAEISWEFPDIFLSDNSRMNFVLQCLMAFEGFPPETKLNCNDYYSILSVLVQGLPFRFVLFVCECIDPSITTGTRNAHRISFGNFLMALPCCIFFPQFMHRHLILYKRADKVRSGLLPRNRFLGVVRRTFQSFLEVVPNTKEEDEPAEDEDIDFESEEEEDIFRGKLTIDDKRIPTFELLNELRRATEGLAESSVQTLMFVMWQKDPTLLECKTTVQKRSDKNSV